MDESFVRKVIQVVVIISPHYQSPYLIMGNFYVLIQESAVPGSFLQAFFTTSILLEEKHLKCYNKTLPEEWLNSVAVVLHRPVYCVFTTFDGFMNGENQMVRVLFVCWGKRFQ